MMTGYMVKKFDEYINELWAKGIERSKTGKVRIEDRFSENDVKIFNNANDCVTLIKSIKDDLDKAVKDTYDDFILSYVRKNGTLNLGFGVDDKCHMPKFDFITNIKEYKNVRIHIYYRNKAFNLWCGNDANEFNIGGSRFAFYIVNAIRETAFESLSKEGNVLLSNLERNFDVFYERLYNALYDYYIDEIDRMVNSGNPPMDPRDINLNNFNIKNGYPDLRVFFVNSIYLDLSERIHLEIGGNTYYGSKLCNKIKHVVYDAFEDAKK